jgi:hypothetical protein
MKSLIDIKNSQEHKVKKAELLKTFRDKIADGKLVKTVKVNGQITEIIAAKAEDPIHYTAYQIFRSDLIKYVAELSDDIVVPTISPNTTLKVLLNKILSRGILQLADPINNDKRSIWIDFGLGMSAPKKVSEGVVIPGSTELQLIITAVKDGEHPKDDSTGVICSTTASMRKEIAPIEPPFSGPVHPKDTISE